VVAVVVVVVVVVVEGRIRAVPRARKGALGRSYGEGCRREDEEAGCYGFWLEGLN
jgi:hypothetical protein